jgi:hypothetical protein
VEQAIAAVDAAPPLVVITDVRLPPSSGFVLARHVRRCHPGTGILMVTGFDRIRGERDFFEGAYDEFLPKPFKLHDLIARTQVLLARRRGIALRYRPRQGDRISVATTLSAGALVIHRTELHDAEEMDERGELRRVAVTFVERWEQEGARRQHALHGKRADLVRDKDRVRPRGLMVPHPNLWPTTMLPELFDLVPPAEFFYAVPVESGRTRATLRGFAPERKAAILHLEVESDFALNTGTLRFTGAGDAVIALGQGLLLEASLAGTARRGGTETAATLSIHGNGA